MIDDAARRNRRRMGDAGAARGTRPQAGAAPDIIVRSTNATDPIVYHTQRPFNHHLVDRDPILRRTCPSV